jgi:hypothetical protein
MEEKNLKDQLAEVNSKLDEVLQGKVKKIKPFKLPSKGKLSKKKVKDNWVTVFKINENRGLKISREPIDNQTIVIDGIPRLATGEDILNYEGKPAMILPSWSLKPFSPTESYEQSVKDEINTKGMALLLARIKAGAIDLKKKMNVLLIVGLVALAGIVLYVVLKK